MTRWFVAFGAASAFAAGCSLLQTPADLPSPIPIESVAPSVPPPPKFSAVTLRVRRTDDGFVAEVLDVRGADPDPRPIEGEARRDAVRRVEHLLGDRARVVDPGPSAASGAGEDSSPIP